jgi:hypothetical protein
VTRQFFSFIGGGLGQPWGWHEIGWWRWHARSASVQEEEEEGLLGWVGQKVGWAGWLRGRLGRKLKEILCRNKNFIFEYTKHLEICTRRFRRDFGMGIFPKFF